jgi:hypothetical protein
MRLKAQQVHSIRISLALGCLLALAAPNLANAQTDLQRAQNLATCLTGKFTSLCKREWLTTEEVRKADIAERQENLRICLTGRYSSLCRRDKLSPQELEQVIAAEGKENRTVCLTGRYKTLCKKNLLSETERKQVLLAERNENARVCLTGRYPVLCDKSLLTQEQLLQATAAERRAAESKSRSAGNRRGGGRTGSSACEAGHWIESVTADGQIIKLEDGSIWEVDPADVIDSALWLPISDIVVCDDKLINTDDNETVSARRIR